MQHKHYNRRSFLGKLGLGCASVGATTLLSGITNMGLVNAAAAANIPYNSSNNYKALVCILLSGGNDSFNMLIPRGAGEYVEYASVRGRMAISQANILPINPTISDGKSYGLHPNLPNLKNLFNNANAAFVANVGALIEPTTLTQFYNNKKLPPGLFSHADQVKHWQTSVPQDKDALGWGGRLADILHTTNTNQNLSMNISLDGLNVFQKANTVNTFSIKTANNGVALLNGSNNISFYENLKRQTLNSLLETNYQNTLEKAYVNAVNKATGNSFAFDAALSNGIPFNTTFGAGPLSERLNMVAKTIAAKDQLQVNRQTFFVQLGGFDTHKNNLNNHALLMAELDQALGSFYATIEELGLQNEVTTFTISDFSRKLVANGTGTDHAWGGNAIVMGGAVNGNNIYGTYPNLHLGNTLDVGNGRLIPTTACDTYFAELALWFGASSSDLDLILPNINNFWTPVSNQMPIGFMS